MRRGILMYHFDEEQWIIWIGQSGFSIYPGSPFELRIQNRYYPVTVLKDTEWFIQLKGVCFSLRSFEVYKVRINITDYIPYVTPL